MFLMEAFFFNTDFEILRLEGETIIGQTKLYVNMFMKERKNAKNRTCINYYKTGRSIYIE